MKFKYVQVMTKNLKSIRGYKREAKNYDLKDYEFEASEDQWSKGKEYIEKEPVKKKVEGSLEVLDTKELLTKSGEQIEYLVNNILPEKGVMILAGTPSTFKSFFALTLCLQGGEDKPFLEKFSSKTIKSLYLDFEGGVGGISLKVKQLMKGHNLSGDNIYFAFDDALAMEYTKHFETRLAETITEKGINLIVIDTIVRAMIGEENSASDMRKVFHTIKTIRDNYDVSFIIIHHLSKHNQRVTLDSLRGSGDLGAMADTVWGLTKNSQGMITMSCLKHRYIPEEYIQPFTIKAENADGDLNSVYFNYQGTKEKQETAEQSASRLLKVWLEKGKIREFSPSQAHKFLKTKGVSYKAVQQAIKQLNDQGDVFQPRSRQPYQVNDNLLEGEDVE